MKYLTIQEYNQQEVLERAKLSNRFIRAFVPNTFQKGGFPDKVYQEQELVRYIDSQHSECFEIYYKELCKGLTEEEVKIVLEITSVIYKTTQELYESTFVVKAPLLAALFCKRVVDVLTDKNKNVHIFELGAGSGMLGAMLLYSGYRYSCTDVTQAFYLVQNRVLNSFAVINELCMGEMVENGNYHIPYWKMWTMRNNEDVVDIVTCNHSLLEMSSSALKFYLRFCYDRLKNSNYGFFFFQGTGWNVEGSVFTLFEKFNQYGYSLVYYDINCELAIFATKGKDISEYVVEILRDETKRIVQKKYVSAHGIVEHFYSDDGRVIYNNDLGEYIYQKLKKIENLNKVSMEAFQSQYESKFINVDGPDEIFSKYIENM